MTFANRMMGTNTKSRGRLGLPSDIFVAESNEWDGKEEYYEEGEIASVQDVLAFLFVRSFTSWMSLVLHFVLFLILVYGYFFGIVLLGSGAEVLGGCQVGSLLGVDENPLNCVLVGILATCICQSSSVTNFVIGSLVGTSITVQQGIYIALGANVGNTFTNSLVMLAHSLNKGELERVVAGASVNDFFYFYALLVFVPIESVTKMLYYLSKTLVPQSLESGSKWTGLTGAMVVPYVNKIIVVNQVLINSIAAGSVDNCQSVYPLSCTDESRTFDGCSQGIVGCDADTGNCPFLFKESESIQGDISAGIIAVAIALGLIAISLFGMSRLIRSMLVETPIEVIARISDINNYTSMLLSTIITMLLGSASLTESFFNPFLAYGIYELEQILPWSLGANIGIATMTVIQSLFSGKPDFLHVALANLFFNVFGIIMWYPVPFMRKFPVNSAIILGIGTRKWRIVPVFHVLISFFGLPLMFLGIVALTQNSNVGMTALGIIILVVIGILVFPILFWWFFGSGKNRFIEYFEDPVGEMSDDDDNISFDENNSEGTSIGGGSSNGESPVKYMKKQTNNYKNRIQKKIFAQQNSRENRLRNVIPKKLPPKSKKRLKKTKPIEPVDTTAQCCTEVNLEGCGIGV